jgi:hypothetical protein
MTITALPIAPDSDDPETFAARADAFVAALATFVTEANALAVALNLNSTTDTSASSVLIGLGAKTFTVTAGKSFQPGMYLIVADTAAPSTNSMYGQVTSYSGTTLVMNMIAVTDGTGSPTAPIAAWTISQSAGGGAYAGLAATATNATTQNQNTNSTAIATTGYVDRANQISVRQTVKFGPVDANGFSDFGGATGGTTVTATGTIYPTASYGMMDLIGSITNPAWTGLSTNGTMYLYVDIAADGTCTTGVGTLAPVYQWGGTYSTTNGQFTFNIQEMTGKVGNGATAAQTYRVYVGEVTVTGGVVAASGITWYALNGKYRSPDQTITAATPVTLNHNIGVQPGKVTYRIRCLTAELGYAVGDVVDNLNNRGAGIFAQSLPSTRLNVVLLPGTTNPSIPLIHKTTCVQSYSASNANWTQFAECERNW